MRALLSAKRKTPAEATATAIASTSAASTSIASTSAPDPSVILPEGTKTLFAYLSHGGEISVSGLITRALSLSCTVAAPRVIGNDLHFHRIDSNEGPFAIGAFGIREPRADSMRVYPSSGGIVSFPVVILVPALAFDRTGNRLGRGAGFYDRFLASFLATFADRRDEITVMGVCHSFQIVESVPAESHDIGVDCILDENGVILCTKP